MRKNKVQDIKVEWRIALTGDWNFRNKEMPSICSKPIAVVTLDKDEFVWKHDDIFELIRAYHKADKLSIDMIKKGMAGSVKTFETPLLDKLLQFIMELKNEESPIQDHPYINNKEQKVLKF